MPNEKKQEKWILEACVDSVESAIAAKLGGANRLELCGNLIIGGTTPGICLFREIRKQINIKTHILIRPRFGDFCYSEYEYSMMEEEIKMFREAGADGVVIGVLTPEGNLNLPEMERLVEAAGKMSVTLHRAFDVCKDPFKALEDATRLGLNTILTSGQEADCVQGMEMIQKLVEKSKGEIDILAGAGVHSGMIKEMYEKTGVTSFHMSGKICRDSKMIYRKENINMGLPGFSEYEIYQTSSEKIREAVMVIKESLGKK